MVQISDMDDDVTLEVIRNLTPDTWKTLALVDKRYKSLFFGTIRRRVVSMRDRIIRVFGARNFGNLAPFDAFYINTTRNIYRRQIKERRKAWKILKSLDDPSDVVPRVLRN